MTRTKSLPILDTAGGRRPSRPSRDATAHLLRQVSVQSVIEIVLQQGEVSRSGIAELAGISKQTASAVVSHLEDGGWLRATGVSRKAYGRSAVTYEICQDAAFVFAVDLGCTKIRAAIAGLGGRILCEQTVPTDQRGGARVTAQIGGLLAQMRTEAAIPAEKIHNAVIGTPGVLDPETGQIGCAPNLAGFDGFDTAQALTAAVGIPLIVENDVNLAMLGEHWAGRGADDMALISLGTGVGMGVMVNGALVRGARGFAGEIAYLPFGAPLTEPQSLQSGAFERGVSAAAIRGRYEAHGGVPNRTVRQIFDQLRLDEPAAAAAVEETAQLVARGIATVVAVLDPRCVILGGSIGAREELLRAVRRALPNIMLREVELIPSGLGDRATVTGAVAVALRRLHTELFGIQDMLATPLSLPRSPTLTASHEEVWPDDSVLSE
ncbi:ROK family transcriptional regulator [Xanthobacter sp. VNH20]|uniref:ROK family protein n=1 Tax=Xanthobacter sp. VNH20 TaxID=3156616 RepID=UPI0032B49E9B